MYLNRLCNASKSSIVLDNNQAVDINHTLVNEGKRQVFLEILAFLNLTPEQIFMLRFGVPYPTGEMQNA